MKLEDFKKFVREDKTIDMSKLMECFSKENFETVTGLLTMTGDKDILIEICKIYAITFALLEDALHFDFFACVSNIYVRATNPKLAEFLDEKISDLDLDDERSWGPQDTEDDDDIVQ